jgi:hypothetical protein
MKFLQTTERLVIDRVKLEADIGEPTLCDLSSIREVKYTLCAFQGPQESPADVSTFAVVYNLHPSIWSV